MTSCILTICPPSILIEEGRVKKKKKRENKRKSRNSCLQILTEDFNYVLNVRRMGIFTSPRVSRPLRGAYERIDTADIDTNDVINSQLMSWWKFTERVNTFNKYLSVSS